MVIGGHQTLNQLPSITVIARPQAVAISRYCLRIHTMYQEIAAPLRTSQ